MQKYVIVKFLRKVDEGTKFSASQWPLHITIASNFAVNLRSDTRLLEKLAALLAKQKPIAVIANDDEYFGPEKDILVTLLDTPVGLRSLHNNLIGLLKSANATFDNPRYLVEGFRPHATVQRDARLHKDELVRIDELTLVDMFPNSDMNQRKVLQTFKLSGK